MVPVDPRAAAAPQAHWKSAFGWPFRDAAWLGKCVRQGLLLFVPVYGWLALLAWQRRVFFAMKAGEAELPKPVLGVRDGLPLLLNLLVLVGVPAVPLGAAAIALHAAHMRVSGWLPPDLLQVPLFVYLALVYPETLRRALAHGDGFGLVRIADVVRTAKQAPLEYLTVVALTFVGLLIGCVGLNMCLLGGLVSIPAAHAIAACLAVQWNEVVERKAMPKAPVYR